MGDPDPVDACCNSAQRSSALVSWFLCLVCSDLAAQEVFIDFLQLFLLQLFVLAGRCGRARRRTRANRQNSRKPHSVSHPDRGNGMRLPGPLNFPWEIFPRIRASHAATGQAGSGSALAAAGIPENRRRSGRQAAPELRRRIDRASQFGSGPPRPARIGEHAACQRHQIGLSLP